MADIILGLNDFTMEVAKNMEELAKVSSMHEEKQTFFMHKAKDEIMKHVRGGAPLTKGWAEILAPQIISLAEREWRVAHEEAEPSFIDQINEGRGE